MENKLISKAGFASLVVGLVGILLFTPKRLAGGYITMPAEVLGLGDVSTTGFLISLLLLVGGGVVLVKFSNVEPPE